MAVLLEEPAPGTAFLAAEGRPGVQGIETSVWSYLYGPDQAAIMCARDEALWSAWLAARAQ